tara:strand:- start:2333 stop:2470 length:138 start_codon:yes stop_codon:yes gene_type:complete
LVFRQWPEFTYREFVVLGVAIMRIDIDNFINVGFADGKTLREALE